MPEWQEQLRCRVVHFGPEYWIIRDQTLLWVVQFTPESLVQFGLELVVQYTPEYTANFWLGVFD
jgi:hypothetical protein